MILGDTKSITWYNRCLILPFKMSRTFTFHISEKYAQVDRKLEGLTTENMLLRNRVDVLTRENIDIKEQIQSIITQNFQINKKDEFVDDYIDKRDTRHLNHFEHNEPFLTETVKQLEEADLQQIPHFNKSTPNLNAKQEKYRAHSDFRQVPATKRSNGDLKPMQVESQKEKRLMLGSGNINY